MLTHIEGKDTPAKIIYLTMMGNLQKKYPGFYFVGTATVDEAMKEHPEYFQEELDRGKLIESIPQSVHDAYYEEVGSIWIIEGGKGIMYYMDHPEEWQENLRQSEIERPAKEKKEQEIWDKYYGPYGLKKL